MDGEESKNKTKDMLKRFLQLKVMQSIKRGYRRIVPQIEPLSSSFALKEYSTYEGHTLCYMFRGSGIEKICEYALMIIGLLVGMVMEEKNNKSKLLQ